jgi:nitrogen fixation/metabolism regulation signal transduction histidine kinase
MSGKKPYRRSWRNLLLDTNYQLVFTLFMVFSCALFMTGLGFLVAREAKKATTIAIQDAQGERELLGNAIDGVIAHLQARQHLLDWLLLGFGVVITVGLFCYGIKMTHHVAGPLHKVSLYFDKVASGKFDKVYSLRKHDQLHDFYDSFTQLHETLRQRQERDVECLRAVIAAAEKTDVAAGSKDVEARLEDLKALLRTKEATLG